MIRKALITVVAAAAISGCDDTLSPQEQARQFSGRWERVGDALPPVALSVRAENGGHVGQVWLSGVTYTLPARFEDSSVVLAGPISSAPAPFVGTLVGRNTMSARIGYEPGVVVTLVKK